jgi:hypothetical protein
MPQVGHSYLNDKETEMKDEMNEKEIKEGKNESLKPELTEAELKEVAGGGLTQVEGSVVSTWTPR